MSHYFANYLRYPFVDMNGEPVERTPHTHPYSFDEYVIWKGEYEKSDEAVYSDRLFQWDSEKYEKCLKEAEEMIGQKLKFDDKNGAETFLSLYFGYKVILTAIMRGCNHYDGNRFYIFFYRKKEAKSQKDEKSNKSIQ